MSQVVCISSHCPFLILHSPHHRDRQGLAIAGMAEKGLIASYTDYTTHDVTSAIQNFLICIEMAGISLAHKFVFSYRDMEIIMSESARRTVCCLSSDVSGSVGPQA